MFAVADHRCNVRSSVSQTHLSPPVRRTDDRTALCNHTEPNFLAPVGKPAHLNSQLCGSGYSRWQEKDRQTRDWRRGGGTNNFIVFAFRRLVAVPSSTEIHVSSQTTGGHGDTVGSFSPRTAVSSCQCTSTNPPYSYFIHLLTTLHNICHWQRR